MTWCTHRPGRPGQVPLWPPARWLKYSLIPCGPEPCVLVAVRHLVPVWVLKNHHPLWSLSPASSGIWSSQTPVFPFWICFCIQIFRYKTFPLYKSVNLENDVLNHRISLKEKYFQSTVCDILHQNHLFLSASPLWVKVHIPMKPACNCLRLICIFGKECEFLWSL